MSSPKMGPFAGRVIPCGLAFIASCCIMVVELVAGRIIARHVGASLYTWTSVIGIVLGGITLGNLMGGRLADWFNTRKTLAVLFLLAAVSCLAVPVINDGVGEAEWLIDMESWPLRIATHVTLVFLLPSTVLGLIGPVVAKMALDQGRSTGRTVGNVYAWGALGSIVGTFATGFYLVALMKTSGVIFSVAGVLALVGISLLPFFAWPFFAACVLGAFLLTGSFDYWRENLELKWQDGFFVIQEKPRGETIFLDESQYSFIEVKQDSENEVRSLILDNLVHAHYVPGDPLDLRYEYEQIYAAVTDRFSEGRFSLRTLFLGGGGYIFPRYIMARWPGSLAQVAEIDPAVTRAVMAELGLQPGDVRIVEGSAARTPIGEGVAEASTPRPIEIYHLDARNHVEDLLRRRRQDPGFEPFDFVYGDAFNDFSVPFHLVTLEFTEKVRDLLRPETGIYMLNVIDIYMAGKFLGAVHETFRKVFPTTYVFVTNEDGPSDSTTQRDTFIVLGAFRELDLADILCDSEGTPLEASLLEEEHLRALEAKAAGGILTDEYAPVENLLKVVVRRR